MAGNLLVVTFRMDRTATYVARQPIDSMAPENPVHSSVGDPDGMVAIQVPHDPNRAQMIVAAQMQDFLYHFRWCLVRNLMREGLLLNQTRIALGLIGSSPQLEG